MDGSDSSEAFDRLLQEFLDRARRGDAPSIEDYAEAHPDLADDIRELFPLLAVVEGLKGEGGAAEAGTDPSTPAGSGRELPAAIGPYEIVRELGQGGMGLVYEGVRDGAEPDDPDARVAIKVVHPHLLEEASGVARFLHEAEAGSRIEHHNVVRTLSTGLQDLDGVEVPYIVLEYVDGHDLRALLKEVGVVPERLCRHVAMRLANALAAVHEAGLVHRDIKPENVVITSDETVKLMDLGVAVLQDTAYRLSQTGQFVGTLLYAAPGQLAGDDPEPAWDLHALGILLYELATGQHPASTARRGWLARGTSSRVGTSLREVNPRISPFLDGLVRSLLAPPDAGSFGSAQELRDTVAAGEQSAWWRAQRDTATPSAGRLRGLERPTRFVGRTPEWQELDARLAEVKEGQGRVALVVGEAGMGKTRLLHEWLAAVEEAPDPPYALVVGHGPGTIEDAEAGLAATLHEVLAGRGLEDRLRGLLGTRAELATPFAHHLRGQFGQGEGATLDPARLDAAFVHVLSALAAERGVVLLYEDLHFAPDAARRHFVLLAHALARHSVLLIGSLRPVPAPTWAGDLDGLPHVSRVQLDGLDSTACRELLHEASLHCPQLDENVVQLAARTDRNPFFILEFVRECMKRTAEERDALGGGTEIPESVRGFLAMRLSQLEAADRELLEAAACCGHEFDPVVVSEAAGLGRIAALKRFGHLEREQGLLRSAGRRYRFRHHLVQELLLADVHPALEEAYHAALGRALEAQTDVLQGGPRAVALCTHFLAGNEPERAGPHVRDALVHLFSSSADFGTIAELARAALAVEGLLGDADRAFALRAVGIDDTHHGRLEKAQATLEESLRLAEGVGDPGLTARVHVGIAGLHDAHGRTDEANASYMSAVEFGRESGECDLVALAYGQIARDLMVHSRLDEAEHFLEKALSSIRGESLPKREANLLVLHAALNTRRGRLDEAEPALLRARELAHAHGDLSTEMSCLHELGQVATRRGLFSRCLDCHERTLEVERQIGDPHLQMDTLCNIAAQLTTLGRLSEAQRRVDEAFVMVEQRGQRRQHAHARMRRGTVRLALGLLGDALVDLENGNDLAAELRQHSLLAASTAFRAEVLALLGRGGEATRVVDRAFASFGPRPSPQFEVQVEAGRGYALELQGLFEKAQAVYEKARSLSEKGTTAYERLSLGLGRIALRQGRDAEGAERLRAAATWGRTSEDVRFTVVPQAWLANLPEGDPLAARVVFEERFEALPRPERVETAFALWKATGDEEHLTSAWQDLEALRDAAPPDDRDRMLENVWLYREIAKARAGGDNSQA